MTTPAASTAPSSRSAHASISPDAIVAQAALPPVLASLVLTVIKRARLWPSERTDVARELSAHFADGLAAGISPEKLAQDFGDPRKAAALIRSSKRRSRPMWYRSLVLVGRSIAATILVAIAIYALLFLRIAIAKPNVARNFSAEYNARVESIPKKDRAWPLYIRALREFGIRPTFKVQNEPLIPGEEGWDERVAWIEANSQAMSTIRAAAALPAIGRPLSFGMGDDYELAMREIGRITGPYTPPPPQENPFMMGVLLPQLGEMRVYARALRIDAMIAAQQSDSARFLSDIRAMLGIARQCLDDPFIISQFVGLAITELTFNTLLETPFTPELLPDSILRDFSHEIAAFKQGHIRLDFEQERAMIEDILQRYFSDDGRGGGYYIGGPELREMYTDFGVAMPPSFALLEAYCPIQSVLLPSRAEMHNLLDRAIETSERDQMIEPWRYAERVSDIWWRRLLESGIYDLFPILKALSPTESSPLPLAISARDITETLRDAVLTKCAITLHHRRTGSWPASLDALVPSFLPFVPLDPFTGMPVQYAIDQSTGSPVVYSIGVDGVDNAGIPPPTRAGGLSARTFRWFRYFQAEKPTPPSPVSSPQEPLRPLTGAELQQMQDARGDWILWKN